MASTAKTLTILTLTAGSPLAALPIGAATASADSAATRQDRGVAVSGNGRTAGIQNGSHNTAVVHGDALLPWW